jgi:hypothetical protein
MSFTFFETWDTAYEGEPADNENINLGAGRIRALKTDIHQRLVIDHSWNGDGNDGKHSQVTLRPAPDGAKILDAGDGMLFANKHAGTGRAELWYQDDAQNLIQITNNGAINVQFFPSGTVLPFIQAAAPTGWVQIVGLNDQVLRTTNGAGAGGGGSWTISGLSAATSVAGHALNQGEIPSHTHNVSAVTSTGGTVGFNSGNSIFLGQFAITSDGGTGGNAAHTHGANTSVSADGTWRPAYVNTIVCSKQ